MKNPRIVTDGYATWACPKGLDDGCGLQVVRPGEVQCDVCESSDHEEVKAPGAIDQRDRFGMSAAPSEKSPSRKLLEAHVTGPRSLEKNGESFEAVQDAAFKFRDSLVAKADEMAHGVYPLWHGWALFDAFVAGAAFAQSATEKPREGALHAGTPTVRRIVELERELAEMSAINHRLAANQIGLRSATAPLSADERETIEIAANVLQLLGGDDNSIVESDLRVILRRTDNRSADKGQG